MYNVIKYKVKSVFYRMIVLFYSFVFVITLNSVNYSYTINNASTHMDYRYFFMNNKNYYDELSTMSLMICNVIERYEDEINGSGDFTNLFVLLRSIGQLPYGELASVKEVTDEYGREGLFKKKNSKIKYVVGEHEVEYTHNYEELSISKKVKLIAIKSIDKGNYNIEDVGENKNDKGYNIFSNADHEIYDKLANSIYNVEYEGNEYCYWVVGYGSGGAVANILAAKLIMSGRQYIKKGNNCGAYTMYEDTWSNRFDKEANKPIHNEVISNVYCYTFGAPYTVYSGNDYLALGNEIVPCHNSIFCSIFNVINTEDIYCYLPSHKTGWDRYGVNCIYSGRDAISDVKDGSYGYNYYGDISVRQTIERTYNDIFSDNEERSRELYYEKMGKKTLREIFKSMREEYEATNMITEMQKEMIRGEVVSNNVIEANLLRLIVSLNSNVNSVVSAHDIGIYYYISKSIKPHNILMIVPNKEVEEERNVDTTKAYREYLSKQQERYKIWLKDEFNFKPYDEEENKILEYLTDLYTGISVDIDDDIDSIKEYHRILASCVYHRNGKYKTSFPFVKTWFWGVTADILETKDEVIKKIKRYFDNEKEYNKKDKENIANQIYEAVVQQYQLANNQDNKNDFSHMSATISAHFKYGNKSNITDFSGFFNGDYNGVDNAGFIGDVCGTAFANPSLRGDDYSADLDAVNLYNRYMNNKNKIFYEVFSDYYDDIYNENNDITRASEFVENRTMEKIILCRKYYKNYLTHENKDGMSKVNDFDNRINYFDNFIKNLEDGNNEYQRYEDYPYEEYN